ncbi:MAG: PAS domain-containing protein, partial [Clostridia bacterium]
MQPPASAPPLISSGLASFSRLAFGVVAAIAACVLWGWALDVRALRDFGAAFPASPAAALAYLLLACSFFAAARNEDADRPAARVAAGLAALIAVLSLVQHTAAASFGMHLSFLPPFGLARESLAEAMAPAAAFSVLLLAAGAPLARDPRLFRVPGASLIALAVGAVAFFALLGWSLRIVRFDIAMPLLGFSLPECLAALIASLGIAARWPGHWLLQTLAGRGTGAVVTRWLLPAGFLVPLVFGWMRLFAERQGLFGEAFGMALFTISMVAVFCALVLWVAGTLERIAAARTQAEEQAGEQREWLHVTLAAIGDGVIATDAGGRVRFLNAAAQRLTGWRAAEAAGRLCCADFLDLFDERTGKPVPCPLDEALRTGQAASAGGATLLRARDGTVHALDVNAAPIGDPGQGVLGGVLVLREAAAQRKAERAMREAYTELDQRVVRRTAALERASAALRERNALLNAITTSTPDLIYAKDRQGRMLMANP